MATELIKAYADIREKIKEERKRMHDLRVSEKNVVQELVSYLNTHDAYGLKISEKEVLTVVGNVKTVNKSKNSYRDYLKELMDGNEDIVSKIIDGRVETRVFEQKLKIIKDKKSSS